MKKFKKLFKKMLILGVIIYTVSIFVNQQKKLNSYNKEKKYYEEQLQAQTEYKETLISTKNNIDSVEFIEKIARERLDMYLPNEEIYVDIGN